MPSFHKLRDDSLIGSHSSASSTSAGVISPVAERRSKPFGSAFDRVQRRRVRHAARLVGRCVPGGAHTAEYPFPRCARGLKRAPRGLLVFEVKQSKQQKVISQHVTTERHRLPGGRLVEAMRQVPTATDDVAHRQPS